MELISVCCIELNAAASVAGGGGCGTRAGREAKTEAKAEAETLLVLVQMVLRGPAGEVRRVFFLS